MFLNEDFLIGVPEFDGAIVGGAGTDVIQVPVVTERDARYSLSVAKQLS